jgi:heme A synthase
MRTLRFLTAVTAAVAVLLVALSPIVRITDSGMGCGPDWPLCHGYVIPPFDSMDTVIEWGHRVSALLLGILTLATLAVAVARRREPGVGGRGGVLRPLMLVMVLFVIQSKLGAITVWLHVPPQVTSLHWINALALLAVLLVATFRAFHGPTGPGEPASRRAFRASVAGLALGGVALVLGGLTANYLGGPYCTGFPLCSGALWPEISATPAHLHWTHRLAAYGLLAHLLVLPVTFARRGEPPRALLAARIAALAVLLQVTVAAWMVLAHLPQTLRVAHAALGTVLWVALVYLVWESRK